MQTARPTRDVFIACALALVLGVAWTVRDWANLSVLRLPDTDDVVRLQQIRDWLGGQSWFDVAQHRMGLPPPLSMHWSRLPDILPAALSLLLGERAAVIATPLLWFAAALAGVAAIARALGVSSVTAMVVAALAYPATTLFLPGRIDHHGMQLVLLLVVARSLLGTATIRQAFAGGLAMAASLVVGMETAPLLAAAGGISVLLWVIGTPGSRRRIFGHGAGLFAGLLVAALCLRTGGWEVPACDGFTEILWRAALVLALVPLALTAADRLLPTVTQRAVVAGIASAIALGTALTLAPQCLSPYGAVDPLLARVWLARVGEAQPLFGAPLAQAIGYAGLMLVGIAATIPQARHTTDWRVLLAMQLVALAVTLVQLRGAYPGALLAAPVLAAMIAHARTRGTLALAGAWIVSAGLLYPLVGNTLAPPPRPTSRVVDCTTPAALARVAALPPGRLIATVDLSAYALASSNQTPLAGPYHRNTAGNRAMYGFYLSSPDRAQAIARTAHITHVAWCDGDLSETTLPADSLAAHLRAGHPPTWLSPMPGTDPLLYRVR